MRLLLPGNDAALSLQMQTPLNSAHGSLLLERLDLTHNIIETGGFWFIGFYGGRIDACEKGENQTSYLYSLKRVREFFIRIAYSFHTSVEVFSHRTKPK